MDQSERVLILASSQRDAESTRQLLSQVQIFGVKCNGIADLINQSQEGAGAVILAKEVLTSESIFRLARSLGQQPAWSFLPILILIGAGDLTLGAEDTLKLLKPLRNTTLIERPVRVGTLTSLIQASLADRKRQYEVRKLLGALEDSKQEAITANRAKSVFLANMSHEIRTPLGAILGFSNLLIERGASEQDKQTYMEAISRNSSHLLALIDDILDLSKVESGKIDVEKIKVPLNELISDVVMALEPKAAAKQLPLRVHWERGVPRHIFTDPIRLKQILINVVGNAIKFTSEGKVDIRLLSPSTNPGPGRKLHIEVADTGVGIPVENIPNLFRPFSQADSSITRKFGGTGLGLVLSKKLAQGLGGDLSLAKTEAGLGSQFMISIDIREPPKLDSNFEVRPEPIPDISTSRSLAGCRVLLVEDSADNQFLISHLLRSSGAEVESANDGIQGVEMALDKEFDIILMDLQMPRLGGHEATQRLRQKGCTKPIVALTAHALKEEKDKCLEAGCDFYLTKPVQNHTLIQTLVKYYRPRNFGDSG